MSAGPSNNSVANRTLELATQVEQLVKGTPYGARARGIVDRLQGPMRVAIAGRVKAAEGLELKPLVRSQRSIFNRLLGRQRS